MIGFITVNSVIDVWFQVERKDRFPGRKAVIEKRQYVSAVDLELRIKFN
jgi:hypothetical protein